MITLSYYTCVLTAICKTILVHFSHLLSVGLPALHSLSLRQLSENLSHHVCQQCRKSQTLASACGIVQPTDPTQCAQNFFPYIQTYKRMYMYTRVPQTTRSMGLAQTCPYPLIFTYSWQPKLNGGKAYEQDQDMPKTCRLQASINQVKVTELTRKLYYK